MKHIIKICISFLILLNIIKCKSIKNQDECNYNYQNIKIHSIDSSLELGSYKVNFKTKNKMGVMILDFPTRSKTYSKKLKVREKYRLVIKKECWYGGEIDHKFMYSDSKDSIIWSFYESEYSCFSCNGLYISEYTISQDSLNKLNHSKIDTMFDYLNSIK